MVGALQTVFGKLPVYLCLHMYAIVLVFDVSDFVGGPVLLGIAKGSAAVGAKVTVTLDGANDGFTGLRAGSLTCSRPYMLIVPSAL